MIVRVLGGIQAFAVCTVFRLLNVMFESTFVDAYLSSYFIQAMSCKDGFYTFYLK